jgi:succinyl-CoA synthetase alpha subunit
MSILVDNGTRLVVQGLTGKEGTFHALACREYGTAVVAGVTPGKGGLVHEGIPVFDTMAAAVAQEGANTSLIFVPPAFAADAILEAADAGIGVIVCVTEGIPTLDMVRVHRALAGRASRLVGPNCPGLISPGKAKVGIMPARIHRPGRVGVISRSGTLTYEAVGQLTARGIGQSTCVGIGGDPIIGTTFVDALRLFQADPETDAILMIGEIGGTAEEEEAAFVKAGAEAGGRLHLRADRPTRAEDGPCGRHHLRRYGHRRREDGGHAGGRHRRGQESCRDGRGGVSRAGGGPSCGEARPGEIGGATQDSAQANAGRQARSDAEAEGGGQAETGRQPKGHAEAEDDEAGVADDRRSWAAGQGLRGRRSGGSPGRLLVCW